MSVINMALVFVLATYMVSKCSYFMLKSVAKDGENKLKVKFVKMYTLAFCVLRWKPACNFN
jgi:hypothetical protein